MVLKLPAGWGARVQTLSVQGSANGSLVHHVVGSAGYTFDPAAGNTVTITFAGGDRPLRAAQHHRQHGLAGGPDRRAAGLEYTQPPHDDTRRRPRRPT